VSDEPTSRPGKQTPGGDPFEREDFGDVTVLRVQLTMLRSDEATEALFQQIGSVVEDAGRSRLVLNFDRVVFLGSAGIGHLVRLLHRVRKDGGRLLLCKVNRAIEEMLHQTHVTDILLLYGDEREALQSLTR
jgi:anti-anti-sigma factor